ncbi:MAG TPA: hypothetical protein VIG66_11085, partial [Noviherbaspirillum sp.]
RKMLLQTPAAKPVMNKGKAQDLPRAESVFDAQAVVEVAHVEPEQKVAKQAIDWSARPGSKGKRR